MSFSKEYLNECVEICNKIDPKEIEKMASLISSIRDNKGRIFFLGVGGGAGHAGHAVNDFRKICSIESYAPTDNVSELTARVNDDGWDTSYVNWLKGSHLCDKDLLFVFSVGGGNLEKNISVNILKSLQLGGERGAKICGVVGRDGGYTAQVADACIVVPTVNKANITPHTEAFQAVVWHLLVAHPMLLVNEMKWESVK
ncbi:MAG: SIS domain-containing protein [Candidatus Marinimicrobia bacterium]|nr:SIS domain-containing protein [Candidatus Neomarinimicrobiota bacterium]